MYAVIASGGKQEKVAQGQQVQLELLHVEDGAEVSLTPVLVVDGSTVLSTPDQLKPLAQATGGTVRRISAGAGEAITLPRFVAMRDSPLYGGADYVGVKRTGASVVTGVGVAPLAMGFLGLIALLGSVLAGWLWEGRRRRAT
jgi:hypothetical protein